MATVLDPLASLDLSGTPSALGARLRTLDPPFTAVGELLQTAAARSVGAERLVAAALLASATTRRQRFDETRAVVRWAATAPDATSRDAVVAALHDQEGADVALVVVHSIAELPRDAARALLAAYLRTGGGLEPAATWLRLAGRALRPAGQTRAGIAGDVVDEVGDAVQWVVDALEAGADAVLSSLETFIDALVAAGIVVSSVVEQVARWSMSQMEDLIAALLRAGFAVGEIVLGVFEWSYDQATTFVMAALRVGIAAADLLTSVIDASYFAFRRIVTGVLAALGGVGQILEWALSQVERVGAAVWRTTLLALRFAGAAMTSVLDWAFARGSDVFQAILWAWESIGEALLTVYEWATLIDDLVWETIGEVTVRLGNSVYYVLNYIVEDFLPGAFNFVRGCLKAGFAYASLLGWALEQSVEIAIEVVRALLDTGTAIVDMLVSMVQRPASTLRLLLRCLRDLGTTLADLLRAVFIDTAVELAQEVVAALVELGEAASDILAAAWEIEAGRVGLVVALLFLLIPGYRPLTDAEVTDARTVFGDSLNYETIFVSRASPSNAVIFGIQDFFTGNPDSRQFVTGRLVNFDVVDPNDTDVAAIERCTLIHELTHVWQNDQAGPVYIADALAAQSPLGAGYNYGYQTARIAAPGWSMPVDYLGNTQAFTDIGFWFGVGGDTALNAAGGDIDAFNREQQGQILMHWFVRSQLTVTDAAGAAVALDATAWQPYRDVVRSSGGMRGLAFRPDGGVA